MPLGLWGNFLTSQDILSVGKARLHVCPGQVRMGGKKLTDIRVMRELIGNWNVLYCGHDRAYSR